MTTSTSVSTTVSATTGPDKTPLALAGKQVHFVGIGGCGMSGLARLVKRDGARCTGSDVQASDTTDALQRDGFDVTFQQTTESVPEDCQTMVTSAAIGPGHPELAEAQRRGIEVLKYAQVLGRLMIGRTGVAIAGTHGKSTTTSMLCHALIQCDLDPSFIVGATCQQIGGGSRCGGSNLLVAEACEFDRSFLHFHPTHAAILNVEEDHLDVYGSIDAIVEAFAIFAKRLPPHGSLLIHHEMAHRLNIVAGLDCRVETLGFAPQADWRVQLTGPESFPGSEISANDAHHDPESAASCPSINDRPASAVSRSVPGRSPQPSWVNIHHHGRVVARWPAALPGEHMAYNAAAAAVTAHRLGATWDSIAAAMANFQGLDRRMQYLGARSVPRIETLPSNGVQPPGQVTVIDDYGHHPTEIDTTLRALRRHYQPGRVLCVFQPHQHSRTRFLMEQFAASFAEADIVVVPHIYFVRDSEQERHTVSAADLVDRLRQRGKQALHVYPFDAIVEQLAMIVRPDDLLVTMGAGDVWKVAKGFMKHG